MSEVEPAPPRERRYLALIVDDERIARAGVRLMLADHPEFDIVGEASNGIEAGAAIRSLAPDIVFLDIQMPDRDGFRLLAQMSPTERPAVVFVTAHRQYAFDAFGVSAVDYLLKPFSRARFGTAIRRVLRFLRGADVENGVAGGGVAASDAGTAPARRLRVRDRGRLLFVDPADVRWFEVYGNYLRLAVDGRYLLLRKTMGAIAEELDPSVFVRISRSVIVNLRHVQSVRHHSNGQYELVVAGGAALRSSRRYRREVRVALRD